MVLSGKNGFQSFKRMDEHGRFIEKILGIKNIMVTTVKMTLGDSQMIELLDFSSHKKLLQRSINDIGPTHLAFTVDNVDEIYEDFSRDGIKFISIPKMSLDGSVKVVFVKPQKVHILS